MARILLSIFLLQLAFSSATAGIPVWQADGVSVCGTACSSDLFLVAPDGQGGVYVTWREAKNYPTLREDVYLQRLTSQGALTPGWPEEGIAVSAFPNTQVPLSIALGVDGSALIAWQDFRNGSPDIYAQKILPDGSVAPGWPNGGAPACEWPGQQGPVASIACDGFGGAFVLWDDGRNLSTTRTDVFLQHLTETGMPAPGWPAGGIALTTAPESQVIQSSPLLTLEDGSSISAWADCRGGPDCDQSFGQRLLPDGSMAPGWVTDGLLLVDGQTRPNIVSDGEGGFYIVAEVLYPGSTSFQDLFVHRFDSHGSLRPDWPVGGLQICCPTAGERDRTRIVEDATGGVLVSWYSAVPGLNVHASRALPDGSLAPGWPFGGVLVSDPAKSTSFNQEIVPDGEGGLFLAWEWIDLATETTKTRVQHVGSDGVVEPGWSDYGMVVASTSSQCHPKIASDAVGGAIVVWEDGGNPDGDLWAQRFVDDDYVATRPSLISVEADESGIRLHWFAKDARSLEASMYRRTAATPWEYVGAPDITNPDELRYDDADVTPGERYAYRLGYFDGATESFTDEVWVEAVSRLAFALEGFRPNPAVGLATVSLTLAKSEPARLEMFDLRGRLVMRRDLSELGAGRHTLSLEDGVRLAPGVYVLRLTQGDQVARVRGVVLN